MFNLSTIGIFSVIKSNLSIRFNMNSAAPIPTGIAIKIVRFRSTGKSKPCDDSSTTMLDSSIGMLRIVAVFESVDELNPFPETIAVIKTFSLSSAMTFNVAIPAVFVTSSN